MIRNWYYTPIMIIYKSNIFVRERNSQTSKIESKKGKKKKKEGEKKGNKEQKGKKLNYY